MALTVDMFALSLWTSASTHPFMRRSVGRSMTRKQTRGGQVMDITARVATTAALPPRLGRLVEVSEQGWFVDYPGNVLGPLRASSLVQWSHAEAVAMVESACALLLLFDQGRPDRPIIAGIAHDEPSKPAAEPAAALTSAKVDGQVVLLEGKERVELRCGKASITLTRAGKIIVRGAHIV